MVTCSLNLRLLLVDCCAKCFVSTYDPTPTLDQSRSRFIRGQDTGKRIQGAALIPLGAFRLYEPNQAERLPQQRNAKSWKMGLALQSCCRTSASWWQLHHPPASHAKRTICTVYFATAIAMTTLFSCEAAHVPRCFTRTTRLPSSQDSRPLGK